MGGQIGGEVGQESLATSGLSVYSRCQPPILISEQRRRNRRGKKKRQKGAEPTQRGAKHFLRLKNCSVQTFLKGCHHPDGSFYLFSWCHISHMQSKCTVNQYISHMNGYFEYKSQEEGFMLPQWSPALVFVSSPWSSLAVSHPSTIQAQYCLT